MEIHILPGSVFLQACFYGIAGLIVVVAAWLVRSAAVGAGDSPQGARRLQRRFLVGAIIWLAVVCGASFAGLLLPRPGRPPIGFPILMLSILALGIAIARSGVGDRLARGAPLAALVGFQAFRFPLELALHRANSEGLMPIQMSYSGRNFDIATGITALALGVALAITTVPRWLVAAWNVLGLLLLANILIVAMLSTPVFAYFGPDRLNVWVMWMPYTLLPAVMVLAAWAGHLIVFRALAQPSRSIQAGSSM